MLTEIDKKQEADEAVYLAAMKAFAESIKDIPGQRTTSGLILNLLEVIESKNNIIASYEMMQWEDSQYGKGINDK